MTAIPEHKRWTVLAYKTKLPDFGVLLTYIPLFYQKGIRYEDVAEAVKYAQSLGADKILSDEEEGQPQ